MVEKFPENEIPLLSSTNFVLYDEKLKKKKNDRKGFQKKRFIYSLLMAKNWRKKNGGRET